MTRIGIRELRQNASAWLRRVAAGESFEVTDRGRPVALLVPVPPAAGLDALVETGRARPGSGRLSARELEVVGLVVEGRSNDEIGAALGIGAKTVETHLRRLFERFEIGSRTELAARALREGWLEIPPG